MKHHRVGSKGVRLAQVDPRATPAFAGDKDEARERTAELGERLDELQDLLYANRGPALLVVLQGLDTAGKDGTIRKVFASVDPLGVRVASFKAPTDEELAHDFLWRVHQQVPAAGEIGIFNRSHYEDVLVVRVEELVPRSVWQRRYERINEFERLLADGGTQIVKFFLHISRDEQRERLQERLDEPRKRWKFRRGDLVARAKWDQYMAAYQEVLDRTSTAWAPWYVVPADRNWYRDFVVSSVLVETLEKLKLKHPAPEEDLRGVKIE